MHSLLNFLRIDSLLDVLVYGRHKSNTIDYYCDQLKGGEESE